MRPSFFHPWLTELALIARNSVRDLFRHWAQSLLHGAAWSMLGTLVLLGLLRIDGDRFGLVLRLLIQQPTVTTLVFAAFGFALTRAAILALADELREGCWGAMPVSGAATQRTLILATVVFAACAGLVVAGLLCLVALTASHWRDWFASAIVIMPGGLMLGAMAGCFAANRVHADRRPKRIRVGSSKPLVSLPGLNHPKLNFFAEWQRRELLRRWRSGGRIGQFAFLLLLIPANDGLSTMLGLLIVGLSLIWFGLALRASEDVIVGGTAVFAAMPLRFERFAAASLRYPLYALLGTIACSLIGLRLQQAPLLICAIYAVLLTSLAGLSLVLCWRYRHSAWRARARMPAETALLAVLFQQFGPAALALLAALLLRHYHVARVTR
ncbi:MAG: hypothetical protein ABI411_10395 [Tahibacter sp.]